MVYDGAGTYDFSHSCNLQPLCESYFLKILYIWKIFYVFYMFYNLFLLNLLSVDCLLSLSLLLLPVKGLNFLFSHGTCAVDNHNSARCTTPTFAAIFQIGSSISCRSKWKPFSFLVYFGVLGQYELMQKLFNVSRWLVLQPKVWKRVLNVHKMAFFLSFIHSLCTARMQTDGTSDHRPSSVWLKRPWALWLHHIVKTTHRGF